MNNESVEYVLQNLMKKHPNYKKQLQEALDCYNNPLEKFCVSEAEFRLDGYLSDIEVDTKMKEKVIGEIAQSLYESEQYINGDDADNIVFGVLNRYALDLSKPNGKVLYKEAFEKENNIMILFNHETEQELITILPEIFNIPEKEYKEILQRKLLEIDKEFIFLGETLRIADEAWTEWKENKFVNDLSVDCSNPWKKDTGERWVKKINETTFVLIEIRNSFEIEFNLCGGIIDIEQFKPIFEKNILPISEDLFSDVLPKSLNEKTAVNIFANMDSSSLFCVGPYGSIEEAREAFDRIISKTTEEEDHSFDNCNGCMGAAFGDCGRCMSFQF